MVGKIPSVGVVRPAIVYDLARISGDMSVRFESPTGTYRVESSEAAEQEASRLFLDIHS